MAAATASLQGFCEEATCSICLEYFEDPITIECGHNFCRACLTQSWKGSGMEEVSCPQCREKVRRILIPNRLLGNFVELTKKLRLQGEMSSTEGKGTACGKHWEPLKLFCKDDEAPICVVCDRSKEHRNHDVVPLEEAAQDYKDLICSRLEVLEKERANILACKAETEEESRELLKQTKAEMEKTKEHFRELRCFLNEQEKLLLAQLEEVEKEITRKRDDHLARLSGELCCLGGLIWEMEEKRQQPPDELLQDVRNLLQWMGEQRIQGVNSLENPPRCDKKEPFQNPLAFPPELKWRFWEACDRNPFLAKNMKQFRDTLLPGSQLQKAKVTLDPDAACPRLFLSENRKSVRCQVRWQDSSDNPDRLYIHYFVLGREGFTAGRHYWEVTVGGEEGWAVGVARKSVRRKETIAFQTEQGIWAVGRWGGGYRASNLRGINFLSLGGKPRRLRVSLNYEGGQLAFHDADTGSHLHTCSGASFSGETLLPFFCAWGKASLTISP